MINYSIVMRQNPSKYGAEGEIVKKAYPAAQIGNSMDINEFAEHISSHGCVYSRADIAAVLTMAVDCIREQLLAGNKINLGDLGAFWVSLKSKGAESAADFVAANDITKVKVTWTPGKSFKNLKSDATFKQVPSRAIQAETLKQINGEAEDSTDDEGGEEGGN